MSKKLYVGNLSYDTTNESLAELFKASGTVTSASVITDRDAGRSRGFGFVEMVDREGGDGARDPDGFERSRCSGREPEHAGVDTPSRGIDAKTASRVPSTRSARPRCAASQ